MSVSESIRRLSPVALGNIKVSGDLNHRVSLNMDRLEGSEYQIPDVFRSGKGKTYDWPADHEGRTILALTLLARVLGREPKYLQDILDQLPSHFNENGYMGRIITDGTVDEQQLSGHSWLLRGLCEHYLRTGDEKALDSVRTIMENLFLPTTESYGHYPLNPSERIVSGEAAGNLTGKVSNGWYPSTDVGCAFIPLDGVTHVYEITRDERIKPLIEAMIAKFLESDLLGVSFQTHATLSACRGILRYYGITGDPALLDAVKRIYGLYISEAITENYENYNWFNRPEWTEPCAVIDSFIVAVGLWQYTGEPSYLEDAHHIFFNAMGYEQRPSGGWGCDGCAGAKDEFLIPDRAIYEAWWCCLMRGGEGLARAVEYLYFTDDNQLVLPFYSDSTANLHFIDGEVEIKQTTDYPLGGSVVLEVVSSSLKNPKTLRLFVPGWVPKESVHVNCNGSEVQVEIEGGFISIDTLLQSGDQIQLSFDPGLRSLGTVNKNNLQGFHTFRHGPIILGVENHSEPVSIPKDAALTPVEKGSYRVEGTDIVLSPINNLIYKSPEEAQKDRRQILFKD